MPTTKDRLAALEVARMPRQGALPHVVPDDTPDAELERLRSKGLQVFRFHEMVDFAVLDEGAI